jgi:hypothetical protein
MIENWSDEFIPPELADNITHLEGPDHHEREGYTVSLRTGNYENDLQAAQDGALHVDDIDNDPFVTSSVYTDINEERMDPNIRLIDALLGVVSDGSYQEAQVDETSQAANDSDQHAHEHTQKNLPTISYSIRGEATIMSSYEDPSYFTGAFPTLFPNGLGGHQHQRPIPVSLAAFGQWALKHHSRRLVSLSDIIILY